MLRSSKAQGPAQRSATRGSRWLKGPSKEVQQLRIGAGEEFRGEGILAAKALLQSGVGYVAGYQGSPISHLMDVLADANEILQELGVHFEASASEATAAATLAASVVSDPWRRHLEIHGRHQRRLGRAGQPGIRRRHRRRAGDRGRGLRRRLVHHAGTLARVRHEIADLAAGPAPQSGKHGQGGGRRLFAVRGQQDAGDAAAAHPRLPRARPLHR